MLKLDESPHGSTRASYLLERVAEALDRPVKAFSDPTSFDQDRTAELLQLWARIEHDQDRLKVLSFIRTVVS